MVLFEGHVSLKSWPSSRYDLKNQYHHNCIASTRSHGGISPGRFQRQLSRDVGSWNYGSCSPFSLWLWSRVGVRCKIQSQWKSNWSPLCLCFCLNFQGWIKAPWGISRPHFCWVSADRTAQSWGVFCTLLPSVWIWRRELSLMPQ